MDFLSASQTSAPKLGGNAANFSVCYSLSFFNVASNSFGWTGFARIEN
jgi:hypothetical protein